MTRSESLFNRRLHASIGLVVILLLLSQWSLLPRTTVNFRNSNIPLDSFHSDNLGWPKRVPCGSYKCFYRLKTDPQVGYLVVKQSKRKQSGIDRFTCLNEGWKLAEQLRKEYNINHFLLAPLVNITVTEELASHLNYNMWSDKHQRMFSRKTRRERQFPVGSIIHAQKVQLAPKRHIMIGCVDSKVSVFQHRLEHFLSFVPDKESFRRNVKHHLDTARIILQAEPCLVKDFQVMVDADGQVFHLDFDRCFSSSGKVFDVSIDIVDSCYETLDEMEHQLEQALF